LSVFILCGFVEKAVLAAVNLFKDQVRPCTSQSTF